MSAPIKPQRPGSIRFALIDPKGMEVASLTAKPSGDNLPGGAVRYFAVAYQPVEAGLARITPTMDASARSLGAGPAEVFRRVHLPLLAPSLAAAALLVFVDVMKELPATLVLRPFNFDTLAVIAYQMAADERLGEAALPSLTLVLAGVVPVVLLSRAISRATRPGG